MRFFRRSLVALGVAAMLPTVIFAAVGIFYLLRAEGNRVETVTLGRTGIVMTLVDARLQRDIAALDVLASAVYLESENWPELYPRAQRVLSANPMWETVVLIDAQRGEEIFDLRRPLGSPVRLGPEPHEMLRKAARAGKPTVGGIEGRSAPGAESSSQPLAWIHVPVMYGKLEKYVLAAGVRPQVFQEILLALAEPGTTAALVDRNGRFLGRTLDYEARLGTPATKYVLAAMRSGARGFYRGITYEGLENYTAFSTSSWSGWSAHLAVASSLIDTPASWSFAVAGLAGLGGILLGGILVVLVLRDMAESRRAEESLRQSQKMEAVGQLTGGIAHDFNNLLTAVIGNIDMIRTRAAGNDRLQRLADNALEAARRGAKLASQLLAFSRSQGMEVGNVDLQQLLNGMSGLLTQSVGPAIEIRVSVEDDARLVVSDANQLELALLNLAVNARDAMPAGGVLTIEARRAVNVDRTLPDRQYVNLCVSDNGTGMPDDVRARAIEPFFTTKPVGQGTGLGLSQVYGVVRESGGALKIDSEVGRGTTVCLTLPGAAPEIVAVEPAVRDVPPTAPKPLSDPETRILVVDDDKLVRRFMTESLRGLGYRVFDADSGVAALGILNSTRIDLLLADFAMPGMNGADVVRAAQLKQPGLHALIVSGYADSAAVEAAALGSARLLRKPFDLAELGAAVAEILQAR